MKWLVVMRTWNVEPGLIRAWCRCRLSMVMVTERRRRWGRMMMVLMLVLMVMVLVWLLLMMAKAVRSRSRRRMKWQRKWSRGRCCRGRRIGIEEVRAKMGVQDATRRHCPDCLAEFVRHGLCSFHLDGLWFLPSLSFCVTGLCPRQPTASQQP